MNDPRLAVDLAGRRGRLRRRRDGHGRVVLPPALRHRRRRGRAAGLRRRRRGVEWVAFVGVSVAVARRPAARCPPPRPRRRRTTASAPAPARPGRPRAARHPGRRRARPGAGRPRGVAGRVRPTARPIPAGTTVKVVEVRGTRVIVPSTSAGPPELRPRRRHRLRSASVDRSHRPRWSSSLIAVRLRASPACASCGPTSGASSSGSASTRQTVDPGLRIIVPVRPDDPARRHARAGGRRAAAGGHHLGQRGRLGRRRHLLRADRPAAARLQRRQLHAGRHQAGPDEPAQPRRRHAARRGADVPRQDQHRPARDPRRRHRQVGRAGRRGSRSSASTRRPTSWTPCTSR